MGDPFHLNHGVGASPSGSRVAEEARPDHLVYLRVFEGCNLECRHCFIPHNPKRLNDEVLASVGPTVRRFAAAGSRILIQWHGGEPTVFGPGWMDRAVSLVEESDRDLIWLHGIQTNLMNYTSEWARVYQRHFGGQVGVSWDPEIRLYKGSNEAYEIVFWRNLEQLLADGLSPYLVVTGTRVFFERYRNPMDFMAMLEDRGIVNAHIERVTPTGSARIHWDEVGVTHAEFSRFMSRFAMAYSVYKQGGGSVFLSPFDGLLRSLRALRSGRVERYGCWSGACDTRFHTIDANGYRSGCTAVTADPEAIPASRNLAFMSLETLRTLRQVSCDGCEFRPVCSSGCHAISVNDGSNECSGGRGFFRTLNSIIAREEVRS